MTKVGVWQEYISSLPDEKFFHIMRLYLGEIKTPYNKFRLTEQLASFLKNPENIKSMISLFDELDLKILTSIHLLPSLTKKGIINFLSDEYDFSVLYSRLENLHDRQLIFCPPNKIKTEPVYVLNPLLKDDLSPYLNPEIILPKFETSSINLYVPFLLNPNFLAAFISYLKTNGCQLKADGNFRKTDITNLEKIFGKKIDALHLVFKAFINLYLVRDLKDGFEVDDAMFEAFAELSELQQNIFLCVASSVKLGRENLKKQTQLFSDCLASISDSAFTKKTFLRLANLIYRQREPSSSSSISRFSMMLETAQSRFSSGYEDNYEIRIMEYVFDNAVEFGFFATCGKAENGEDIYKSQFCNDNESTNSENIPKVLNINATSSVILLPGLSLKKLLPFTSLLQIISYDTATEFEINKHSVSAAFDKGFTIEKILSLLSEYAAFDVPQNLLVNLEEWYASYSSTMIYKGYILKVSKDNILRIENNPNISSHIQEKLAEGIYLLDIPVNENISDFLKNGALDFMGTVRTVSEKTEIPSFPKISEGHKFMFDDFSGEGYKKIPDNAASEIEKSLLKKLDEMNLNTNQKEVLLSRIESHLIFSSSQIVPSSVRTEILEANGIDYRGKLHLIEASIKNSELIEITLPSADGNSDFTLIGRPLQIFKKDLDATLRMEILPTEKVDTFYVSKIMHVKRGLK